MESKRVNFKPKGFAVLVEAEKKYDHARSKPVVKTNKNRKSVRKGDEYYEW